MRAKYLAAAAVMALTAVSGVFSGVSVSAAEEKKAQKYPTALTADKNSEEYKDFLSAKTKLSSENPYDYYGSYRANHQYLVWEPVDHALFYELYEKKGKKLKKILTTFDTRYWGDVGTVYAVKPITYDTDDNRLSGTMSDKFTIPAPKQPTKAEYEKWWEEEGQYEEPEEVEDGGWEEGEDWEEEIEEEIDPDAYDGGIYTVKKPPRIQIDEESYAHYDENTYKRVTDNPLCTISADVDTAAYSNARRQIKNGYLPKMDSVRTEEFLNYFDYHYDQPEKNPFTVTYELSDCPWNKEAQLLMVGIQSKDMAEVPDSNIVFLVDVSGSMADNNKLPYVQDSLNRLAKEMSPSDRLSIVTYSGKEHVLISGASGNMTNCVKELTDLMYANGGTYGEAGINMAYEVAQDNFIEGGANRVVLATDGDLNVGISDPDELADFIADKRKSGVYLTVLGFGEMDLKDDVLEALAQNGNGNYHYIDDPIEAQKVLVDEKNATLIPAADDVKIQLEFNPNVISRYRLIGYEGRRLKAEDFVDDKKDAADMGSGQSVTVMYELLPSKGEGNTLKYMNKTGNNTDVCTVKFRYKNPGQSKSVQSKVTVTKDKYQKYENADVRFRFASCVAETAMVLKGETSYGNPTLAAAKKRLKAIDSKELETIGYSDDFVTLLNKAIKLQSEENSK